MWPFRRKRHDRSLWQIGDLPLPRTYAGMSVTADSALRLSAVWGCVRLLSDTISTLPVDAYRAGSREPIEPKPAILATPAAGTPLHDWLSQVVRSLLLTGNQWGLVADRGAGLRPSQIELLAPGRATVQVDTDGTVTHRLDGQEIPPEELWHIRAYPVAGQVEGLSPIAYARQTIGLGLAAEKFGASFFGDGATPSGILVSDDPMSDEGAELMMARWKHFHGGKHGTALLSGGVKFQRIQVAPEESQFLDSQRFTVSQVCRLYGVPPEMIAESAGDSLTYANVEQRSLDFLTYCISPWLVKIETALTDLLPRGQFVKFNANALVRTDLKTRYDSYAVALDKGFLTINEVRALEDREPLPTGSRPQLEAVAS